MFVFYVYKFIYFYFLGLSTRNEQECHHSPQERDRSAHEQRPHAGRAEQTGMNCTKIGLPGKLILSKRKGLQKVLFSWKYYLRIYFPWRSIFIQLPPEERWIRWDSDGDPGGEAVPEAPVVEQSQCPVRWSPRRPRWSLAQNPWCITNVLKVCAVC